MNIQIYSFHLLSGSIPGIPNPNDPSGEFHAGQRVAVDLDTGTILACQLINASHQDEQQKERSTFSPEEEREGGEEEERVEHLFPEQEDRMHEDEVE